MRARLIKRYATSSSGPSRRMPRGLAHSALFMAWRDASTPTSASSKAAPTLPPRPMSISKDDGIGGIEGFTEYAGSLSGFMKPVDPSSGTAASGPLPCDVPGSEAAVQAAQAELMAGVAMTGKLPSPRDRPAMIGQESETKQSTSPSGTGVKGHRGSPSSLPRPRQSAHTPSPSPSLQSPFASPAGQSTTEAAPATHTPEPKDVDVDVEAYYNSLPQTDITKEEMWKRISSSKSDRAEQQSGVVLDVGEADFLKMESDLATYDMTHFRLGEVAYPDKDTRRDYYALWYLAMSLNRARWGMLEVQSQRGVKTTGAGMKLLFWKESVGAILDNKSTALSGQFVDSHPVLRPFAATFRRNPKMTKMFVRGFTDARLKVVQQPGSVKQLFDHYDKFYGYFYASLLEATGVKDDAAEHVLLHVGRATGLTSHSVMFWKKYAKLGFTMLPADLCADNHVNLALLRNVSLASSDRAVRHLLYEVMCIARDEMLHAEKAAKDVDPKAWPIIMECIYANYYLGFLQRRSFNVSAMFADYNIENAGFSWYRLKKFWEWRRHQSIERLLQEAAPIPFLGRSLVQVPSKYKVASGVNNKGRLPPASLD